MAIFQCDATTDRGGNSLRNTLSGYFVRYRLVLYTLTGAAVASCVALHWSWLTVTELLRLAVFLPCALMMLRCMKHGTRRSNEETALQPETLPSRFSGSSDPH